MSGSLMVKAEENEESNTLQRPCTQQEFDAAYKFKRRKSSSIPQTVKRRYSKCSILSVFLLLFPVFKWLPHYKCKTDLAGDLAAGFTIAIMHISQGMAYAALGAVNPIVGVYTAMFPVLVYVLMGTSRHISMGSFSIICLMAAKPVVMYSTVTNTTDATTTDDGRSVSPTYSPIQVASVVCLTVGMFQVLLGFCKVGSLSMFMSESLVSGFTTGAAVLVFISQLQHVFGVELPQYFGIFNVIYTISDLVREIPNTNYLALTLSVCVILTLLVYTDVIKPMLNCKCLFPIELIVMIIGTIISHSLKLHDRYSINIVGSIPMGFPAPEIPVVKLIPKILVDCLVIAIVSFSINISMATMFAIKDNYKIDANQELVASGFGNMFGGFFSCLPMAVSLTRSMIQYTSGGKTQLASVFSCLLLVSVMLYLGKFLSPLPYSVLAGIVIKSLKSMLMQVKDLPKIWKHSLANGIIWLVTFFCVVLLNIEIGLGVSLLLSLLSIILMSQKIYVCLLGKVPNTDVYLEINRYPAAKPIPNFVIVQINAGLHFANIHVARNRTERLVNEALAADTPQTCVLVLDMSGVTFVDPAALHALNTFISNLKRQDVSVCFAQCTASVYEQMKKCDFFNDFSENDIFPTIHDAVLTYQNSQTLRKRNQVSYVTTK